MTLTPESERVAYSPLQRRLRAGGGATFVARAGTALLNVISAAVVARGLAPADFGSYVLAQTLVTFGSVVAALGLENTVIRSVARLLAGDRPGAAFGTVRTAQQLVLVGIVGTSAILIGGRQLLIGDLLGNTGIIEHVILVALWLAWQALNQQQVAALRGAHQLIAASVFDGFARSVFFFGSVVVLHAAQTMTLGRVLLAAAATAALSTLLGSAYLWRWSRRHFSPEVLADRSRRLDAAMLLRESWPLMGSTVLGFAIAQADVWFVSSLGSPAAVAVYGAATRLIMLVTLPLVVVNSTIASTIAALHARDEHAEMQSVCRSAATAAGLVTAVVVVVIVLAGESLLSLLFGSFYARGAPVLAVLAIGRLAQVWTGSCGMALMMTGHQRAQLTITSFTVVAITAGAIWSGPRYGMMGIAVVYSAAIVANNLVTLLYARRVLNIWTHMYLSPRRIVATMRRLNNFSR